MSNSTPLELKTIPDHEIDLFQLVETLWRGKILIIFTSLLFLAIASCYTFYTTPIYESRAYLLPPTNKGIIELSKAELLRTDWSDISKYSRKSVYEIFIQRLNSNNAKQNFFEQEHVYAQFINKAPNELQAWKLFNKALSIEIPKNKTTTNVEVSFKANSPEQAALWTNNYINMALNLTRKEITDDLQEKRTELLKQFDLLISNRHKRYQAEINAELEKLHEALLVAETVKLIDPLITDSIIEQKNAMMVDEIRRLYRSGSTALKAEISALEQRRGNKTLIPGIAELIQQKTLIESLNIDSNNIHPVEIDLVAQVDNKPVSPKRLLILALSLILGLLIGTVVTLIRSAIYNRKMT